MKNYLIYPCKTMRITQSYTGTTSHLPHTTGKPKDYPIDEGCSDTDRDYICCPCDKMKIKRIYGVGTGGTNTLWLESTEKVLFADGTENYCTLLITHPNDDDLKKLKVGQVFTRKEKICREGKDGATAYHLHISAGKGRFKGNGWAQNSNGKYVLTTTGITARPDKLFFVDRSFTKVIDSKGLKFKELPEDGFFFPVRGYFKKGDKGENIKKINDFYYNVFPDYEKSLERNKEDVKGDLFGENTEAWTKEFQRRNNLKPTGRFGKKTLTQAKKHGFKA